MHNTHMFIIYFANNMTNLTNANISLIFLISLIFINFLYITRPKNLGN